MDNAEAIKRIEELTKAATANPMGTDYPCIILPSGMSLKSLEQFGEHPYRMRQRFETERLPDFCKYVLGSSGDSTAVFVEPSGSGAEAVIDYGTHDAPLWGEHRARLTMRRTTEFQALEDAANRFHFQGDLVDFLEDWAHILTPYQGDEEITISAAIGAIRKVDISSTAKSSHEEHDFQAKRTAMEEIEARSGAGALPGRLDAYCRVYPHTASRFISLRMSLQAGADKPRFRLRIVGLDRIMEEVAREVERELTQELDGLRVFVGSTS